jgi:hypothetical protein
LPSQDSKKLKEEENKMKEHSLVLMQQFVIITNSRIWNMLELPQI